MIVLTVMAIAAAIGGYAVLLLTVRGRDVTVPNLVQMTPVEAAAEADRSGLKVEQAGSRIEPRIGEGRIFEQDPPAGAHTRSGRAIRVYVSLGQASLLIPALSGEPVRKAQLTLEQMGLRMGNVARVSSPDRPVDQILAQRPAAGSRRQTGDAVDFLVSAGAPERVYVMPALTGLALERASAMLGDAGVRVGVSHRSASSPAGVVIEQRPPEGHPLRERQPVQLVVAQ